MDLEELLKALTRIKRELGRTPEYKELRKKLPRGWPM
jgi:hypothetical protein